MKKNGFTIIEVIIVLMIISITSAASLLIIKPRVRQAEARDDVRISDVATIERAVNEYLLDFGAYPDAEDTSRNSITLPTGNTALDNAASGWINADLSTYTARMPIDPINDSTYLYSYHHTTSTYEINAVLEFHTDQAVNDGGDDAAVYEVGNDLTQL